MNDHFYHIYSRSIAKYVVFNNEIEYGRMLNLIDLYRFKDFDYRFSKFLSLQQNTRQSIISDVRKSNNCAVDVIAYCVMPTHFHFVLKQKINNGITEYIGRVLNSYSKFFNIRHNRSGPLWTGPFMNVLIKNDEQLIHLTRYIHLNPTSAGIVKTPEDWAFSSYREYVNEKKTDNIICNTKNLFETSCEEYKNFVNDQKAYQRELSQIKSLMIDNYSG